ncbi:Hypothetical protein NTJ_12613 [Nesidiocoris tenuis]|uniref:F-actin monooxygenase n=1 Tax=Nesidiocoris tenuis TaxID=355587 RepID=A0ABN7B9F5_9HEMI|nr:Hypothetical protein NTJ_12613 [Nesidiocoris tenuis]
MERPEIPGQAAEIFDQFCSAGTLKSILNLHRQLCDILHIRPTHINQFYPKLKAKLKSWRAQALWNKFDKRASHKCYNRGKACTNLRVLVIGAGPCGLRAAIEAQLLGAKVVVVEKRDRITRNNVLHLWPFVIHDLKALGAKKFFGRFCAGAIDHISIRQLQCILLKVALILGVEIHEGVGFESLIPPPDDQANGRVGWRAETSPPDHPVSQYEFDVLMGADGKRNTLEGFKRKEFRGKLAIAITANFINRHSEAEARVEEISGVAFIFNQKFFKDLYATTGIDLENIVYYKDDTHYFVMTAKKHSLIDKGVIISDYSDTAKLLSADNVDKTALMQYAREAADFSTGCRLPQLEFAVNHYGQPDVAMFDFTSMYAAENASRFVERHGHKLYTALVGDSLLEPFWPTGSGCARGFLSSMDACWAMRSWGLGAHPLEVLAERESIYRLLAQTTPENLQRDLQAYTLDPCTRYPNLNSRSVLPVQMRSQFNTDDPNEIEQYLKAPKNTVLNSETPKKRKRRDAVVHADTLLHWLQRQVALCDDVTIENVTSSFKDGMALCAIINRYRPHLLDFALLNREEVAKNNQIAFDILEQELAIPPVMTGDEMAECEVPDKLAMLSYLSQVYEAFRGEIPHVKHPKMEETEEGKDEAVKAQLTRIRNLAQITPQKKLSLLTKLTSRPSRRRRSHLNSGAPIQGTVEDRLSRLEELSHDNEKDFYDRHILEPSSSSFTSPYAERIRELERERRERARRREDIERNRMDRYMRRKYLRHIANQQFYKSISMLQSNARDDEEKQPIEDFSLFVYRMTAPDFKDRVKELENKLLRPDRANRPSLDGKGGGNGEEFSGRVKDIEAKLRGTHTDKKPKDLLRAIGKIEKTDWNVKQIEQKIEENRMGRGSSKRSEKVPKWSKEQFEDKMTAVQRKLRAKSNKIDENNKYNHIDNTMKSIEKRVKEGFALEQGKVSAMAEHLAKIHRQPEPTVTPTGKVPPPVLPSQGASENCHFCHKRVYLMERLSAEGRFFHRGCFRCQYCSTALRLGNYAFDREGKYGHKFYCVQHFGLQGTAASRRRDEVKPLVSTLPKPATPTVQRNDNEVDMGLTPERVEFENLSCAEVEVEEDEFTDRNFGLSTTDVSDTSQGSDSSSESDGFAEAEDGGLDPEETLRLVKDWTRRYASSYNSSDSDESDTEMDDDDDRGKKKKNKDDTDSGSDTEVQSDDYSGDESSEEENSATEISTDSEFEHDGTTHTIPDIVISETVQVKRGNLESPKQVQFVQRQLNGRYENAKSRNNDLRLELNRIEPQAPINTTNNKAKPLLNPNRGDYLLNRTQSTEGIASKISLELKKKYLLGPQGLSGNVRKSGSTSTLDTKFKSLIDQISEQQKLLNPAPVPSPTMQAFLQGADRLKLSPLQLLEKKTLPTEDFKHVCSLKEKDEVKEEKKEEEEVRPRSPVHETSIVVPDFPRNDTKEVESDSLSSELSSSTEDTADEEEEEEGDDVAEAVEEKANNEEPQIQTPPKLEIHNSRGELMEDTPEMDSLNMPDICQAENEKSPIDKLDLVPLEFKKVITVPDQVGGAVLTQVTNTEDLYFNEKRTETPDSSDSLKNDLTAHTETEMSDWARDEDGVSEPLDDLEFADKQEHRRLSGPRGIAKTAKPEDFDEYTHVCGKETPVAHNALNLDNLEFMDTGDESSEASSDHHLNLNRGYVQFINNDEDLTPVVEYVNPLKEELTDTTTTSEPTTVKDSPAEGLKTVTESIVTPEVIELAATAPGKVPYGTVRDSIVVMKRNHLKEAAAAVAAVAAAAASVIEPKGNALNSPATTRKLEQLSQERAKQKDLIHEMVMNKLIAQGKSPTERIDRKKRLSRNFSPVPHAVPPSVVEPKPIIDQEKAPMKFVENNENVDVSNRMTPRTRSYTVGSVSSSARRRKEAVSLPNIHAAAGTETPLGAGTPLDLRSGLREQARAKFKMMSNEQLGLSPEDKLKRYKLKIQKQLKDETPKSSRNDSRYDILKKSPEDRKKSIIQAVSDFFHKKSPSSPKTPSSHYDSKNLTLTFINKKDKQNDAPPVPPPPQAYTPSQEGSLSEEETHSGDNTSLLKKQRVTQRIARQAQSKRLRMAQEVQRQLEELEVKQKELEVMGVAVEKAIRGEVSGENRNESELLAEWLRLTRERSEARSKEKTLVIRGQEIELEHRHARLQAQLSDIMSSAPDGRKSSEEVALEGRILREMLEIVERKNSLAAQLQAETQRFQEEDRDLEAQMIAKGLHLPQRTVTSAEKS